MPVVLWRSKLSSRQGLRRGSRGGRYYNLWGRYQFPALASQDVLHGSDEGFLELPCQIIPELGDLGERGLENVSPYQFCGNALEAVIHLPQAVHPSGLLQLIMQRLIESVEVRGTIPIELTTLALFLGEIVNIVAPGQLLDLRSCQGIHGLGGCRQLAAVLIEAVVYLGGSFADTTTASR